MVSVSYKSHKVSNFHSSRSTATKNCLIPSSVNSSLNNILINIKNLNQHIFNQILYTNRFTKILIGSVINLFVISNISCGKVADIKITYEINRIIKIFYK